MSKPESTGAKSLEEILASIRKSLADEATERPPEPRAPSLKAAQPQLKPAAPDASASAKPASAPAKGGGVLTAKLAGATNGAGRGHSLDPDLSELLAGEPKKPAPAAPAEASKPASTNAGADDDKDPLWFLSRLSAAAAGPAGQGSAARARDAAKASTPADEIKLSRPETLRASFPPLFGTVTGPAPTIAKSSDKSDKPHDASMTARTQPRVLTPQADAAPAKDTPKEAFAAKDLGKVEPIAPLPATLATLRDEPVASAQPAAAADKPGQTEPAAPTSTTEAKPLGSAAAEPGPSWASESAPVATVDALPTRALEQMVAELLEPVIRQWLQTNLPRLIEKAVREEVARVVAAEREAKKA